MLIKALLLITILKKRWMMLWEMENDFIGVYSCMFIIFTINSLDKYYTHQFPLILLINLLTICLSQPLKRPLCMITSLDAAGER